MRQYIAMVSDLEFVGMSSESRRGTVSVSSNNRLCSYYLIPYLTRRRIPPFLAGGANFHDKVGVLLLFIYRTSFFPLLNGKYVDKRIYSIRRNTFVVNTRIYKVFAVVVKMRFRNMFQLVN